MEGHRPIVVGTAAREMEMCWRPNFISERLEDAIHWNLHMTVEGLVTCSYMSDYEVSRYFDMAVNRRKASTSIHDTACRAHENHVAPNLNDVFHNITVRAAMPRSCRCRKWFAANGV